MASKQKNPKKTIKALLEAIHDENACVRCAAARAIVKAESKHEVQAVLKALLKGIKSEDVWIRLRAVEGIVEVARKQQLSEEAAEALAKASQDGDHRVRRVAAHSAVDGQARARARMLRR